MNREEFLKMIEAGINKCNGNVAEYERRSGFSSQQVKGFKKSKGSPKSSNWAKAAKFLGEDIPKISIDCELMKKAQKSAQYAAKQVSINLSDEDILVYTVMIYNLYINSQAANSI